MVLIKGREYTFPPVKDSHNRRALQFKNAILDRFHKIGLSEDDVEVPLEPVAFRKAPAAVMWWFNGQHQYYSYSLGSNFAENLSIVQKVLEREITALVNEEQTLQEFVDKFKEDTNIEQARKEARETLGLPSDSVDMDLINRTYKELAKRHHPDKADGDKEKFQRINSAHKTLKRELE